jgi:hypothetical protein
MSTRGPLAATVVNALIVLLLPGLLLLLLATLGSIYPALADETVYARPVSPLVRAARLTIGAIYVTAPLAAVAAWRTWVHATKWQMHHRTWWGVAEAAAVGALLVIVLLVPPVLTAAIVLRSLWGFAAIAVYAAIGSLVGLVLGLMLQVTAMIVLKIASLRGPA